MSEDTIRILLAQWIKTKELHDKKNEEFNILDEQMECLRLWSEAWGPGKEISCCFRATRRHPGDKPLRPYNTVIIRKDGVTHAVDWGHIPTRFQDKLLEGMKKEDEESP